MLGIVLFNLTALISIAVLLGLYWAEAEVLRTFAHRYKLASGSDRAIALELAGLIHAQIQRRPDQPFLPFAAFDILGATPISVLQGGGCCSGLSRLYITTLGSLGIRAAQVTLYHRQGQAQHCLAEVQFDERHAIIDPLYGFYYVDRGGEHMGLEALRAGVQPDYRPLPYSQHAGYPANDYYNFVFSRSKTANWTKTWIRRSIYWLLAVATGGRIDTMRQRLWMEWPQIVVALGLGSTVLVVDLIAVSQ